MLFCRLRIESLFAKIFPIDDVHSSQHRARGFQHRLRVLLFHCAAALRAWIHSVNAAAPAAAAAAAQRLMSPLLLGEQLHLF